MLTTARAGAEPDERWRRMMDAVGRVTDRLGRPVDPGIRETVAALNLAGLATTQSCEGHADGDGHGLPAPWVDLAAGGGDGPNGRVRALLGEFYADDERRRRRSASDLRLRWDGRRLSNGGTHEELDAVRRRLAGGEATPAERRAARRRLAARQAEMRRFARFLRARLAAEAGPGEGVARASTADGQERNVIT